MCGRYFLEESPELRPIVEEMNRSPLMPLFQDAPPVAVPGEIRPSAVAPVVAYSKAGKRTVYPMKWGFTGKTLLINARAETAASRVTFREAWQSHRCAVPASWYFEWEHLNAEGGKKKIGDRFRLRPRDSGITWLCGLYRIENGLPCYVILTREPGEGIRFLHDRMPLMLPEEYAKEWIRPDADPAELVQAAQTDIQYERLG